MINSQKLLKNIIKNDINFFCGVPDSILKFFSQEIASNNRVKNIITPNEGSSIALAAGYYLSKKKLACVYMQNSGLGNAINPLASIVHKKVYSIPMIILIGWRGAKGEKDEPQHVVKGTITKKILSLLGIKFIEVNSENFSKMNKLIKYSKTNSQPVAFLFKNNIFEKKNINIKIKKDNCVKRNLVINKLLNLIKNDTKLVSTTGFTSRELFQLRNNSKKKNKGKDFYMVGGMGHASMVTLGVSLNTKKKVICLDGDGSFFMHLGALNTVGFFGKKNFKHILFNNYSHESVGGQPTYSENVNIKNLVLSMGYKYYKKINKKNDIDKELRRFLNLPGSSFLEVKTSIGSFKNLTRPKNLIKIKDDFKNTRY